MTSGKWRGIVHDIVDSIIDVCEIVGTSISSACIAISATVTPVVDYAWRDFVRACEQTVRVMEGSEQEAHGGERGNANDADVVVVDVKHEQQTVDGDNHAQNASEQQVVDELKEAAQEMPVKSD